MEEELKSAEMTYKYKIDRLKSMLGDEVTVDLDLLDERNKLCGMRAKTSAIDEFVIPEEAK